MKNFRKSTGIAYWVLRALAISSALLLFSITGIVALQTASHATGHVITVPSTTTGATSSPADSITPTPTVSGTTVPVPTATPLPTVKPTQPPPPPPPPTAIPTKPPVVPTAVPSVVSAGVPIGVATATSAAIAPAGPLPKPVLKGTPKVMPSPTPSSSPTATPAGTPLPASSNGNTFGPSNTQQDSNSGTMAMIKPFIGAAAGVGTIILLGSGSLLALVFWRKRTAAQGIVPSFAQVRGGWESAQAIGSAQPTELTPEQHKTMLPFAMQSIAQYSPLLGAPDTSQLDAPVPPPASDFRPLPIDYPQIMEIHTDKMPIPVTPATLQSLSAAKSADLQPVLQLASTQFSPLSAPIEASSTPATVQTPLPAAQHIAPAAYQFPQHDSLLENLMHQAQMGIFALPGKEAQ